jgi:hypothetical protein
MYDPILEARNALVEDTLETGLFGLFSVTVPSLGVWLGLALTLIGIIQVLEDPEATKSRGDSPNTVIRVYGRPSIDARREMLERKA